jgi:thioesterase domain-containing protein
LSRRLTLNEEIEKVTNDFLGNESIRPYVASSVLREKAQRLIHSSLSYVTNIVDHHIIDADIHVLTSEDPITEYRDAYGALLTSMDGWADITRGRVYIHQGVGHHNYMLSYPHLDRNADLILELLDQIVATPCLRSGERAARRSTAAISPADRARR